MPITQERMLNLLEVAEAFWSRSKTLIAAMERLNIEACTAQCNAAKSKAEAFGIPDGQYIVSVLNMMQQTLHMLQSMIQDTAPTQEAAEVIITERVHFKKVRKQNEYNMLYKRYKRSEAAEKLSSGWDNIPPQSWERGEPAPTTQEPAAKAKPTQTPAIAIRKGDTDIVSRSLPPLEELYAHPTQPEDDLL
ncbi:MAG: hypothetical protein ACREHV_06450 [Rhizomicrobium sp.]